LKKYSIIQTNLKLKIAIKRIGIKVVIENKFYILSNGEIKNKNQFGKRIKKIKRIKIRIDIQNKFYIWLKSKMEKKT